MKQVAVILVAVSTLLLGALSTAGQAAADQVFQNTCGGNASNTSVCQSVNAQQSSGDNPVVKVLKSAIEVISYLTGAFAIIFIVVSGLRFILSGGDSNAVATARSSLIYAFVGIMVTVLAQSIVLFVLDKIK